METVLLLLVLALLGFVAWKLLSKPPENNEQALQNLQNDNLHLKEQVLRLELELGKKTEILGQTTQELENEKREKNELSGKNKQMFVEKNNLSTQAQFDKETIAELNKKIIQYEEIQERKNLEFANQLQKLDESRKVLDEEKIRLRKEDAEKQEAEKAMRDRIWNEHENRSISEMKRICEKNEISLRYYDNTNLPEGFDGKMKPDFLVEFLDQYIIFDAKTNKTESKNSIQNYIKDQARSTAKKIKDSSNAHEIYTSIFFIIPSIAVSDMKETVFFEEGMTFYAIPLEAVEPVLSTFKRVSFYENIKHIDPKERESLVHLIAKYDSHISRQNALNILATIESTHITALKRNLSPEFQEEIEGERRKQKIEGVKPTELKKFTQEEEQKSFIKKLLTPEQAPLKTEEILDASNKQTQLFS